jgi:polyisoprenoid-binding protein YceI/predicted small secreted protein
MQNKTHIFLFLTILLSSILLYGCSTTVQGTGKEDNVSRSAATPAPDIDTQPSETKSSPENIEQLTAEDNLRGPKKQKRLILPLDSDKSWVRIRVMRKGKLEKLGHNHIIENGDLSGTIEWNDIPGNIHGEFTLPVEQFVVDDAVLRKNAGKGFEKEVSVNDILSIRRTMLSDRVLDAADFPAIKIIIQGVSAPSSDQAVDITLTIRGKTKTIRTDAKIYKDGGTVLLSGSLRLQQSDFGITPVTLLMGKLTIEDTLLIDYHFEARYK